MNLISLKTELRQELKLTPQLLQSMEVLQMNSQELLDYLGKLSEENPLSETDGNGRFWIMIAVVVINFIGCIVCPLAIPGFSKTPMALPIMLVAMLLPFIYFFVFGGLGLGKEKAAKAEGANIL